MENIDDLIALDQAAPPESDRLERAQKIALEYFQLMDTIDQQKKLIEAATERRRELERKELPDLFAEIGIDRIGLPDAGVDVVVVPYYHANVLTDWPEERRHAAFDWLESNGHGEIVRATVEVSFSRGELPMARELETLIRTQFPQANTHPVVVTMGVPWNTLTALVREQTERGESLPLDTLGATVGSTAKIQKRKK